MVECKVKKEKICNIRSSVQIRSFYRNKVRDNFQYSPIRTNVVTPYLNSTETVLLRDHNVFLLRNGKIASKLSAKTHFVWSYEHSDGK